VHRELPRIQRRSLTLIVVIGLGVLIAAFVVGFTIRHRRIVYRENMAKAQRDQPPVVTVVQPHSTQKTFDLTLPADVRAWATTSLYARTNGYLASWTADINDEVKPGQVLAVIAAPDTDAELEQAQAAVNQQQTAQRLAKLTDERFRGLIAIQGVTQQQLDQNRASLDQANANVRAAEANADRLKALVGFEKIVAPFPGVVTARNYDVGALITATNIGAGQELFDLAEVDKLRVFVSVPQPYVELIKFGQPVTLTLERNFPGHKFTGVVARSTGSVDPVTRTLRTELDFDNRDPQFKIYPGMYGMAIFSIHRAEPVLTVPTSALLFEAEGKEVAVVTPQNKVHFMPIVPGSDFGTEIEAISGLKGDERIIANPGEEIVEGLVVAPQGNAPAGKPAQ
jgi:RND family efflux transporter MFP subunit